MWALCNMVLATPGRRICVTSSRDPNQSLTRALIDASGLSDTFTTLVSIL